MASTRSPVLWSGSVRLAHGWILVRGPSLSKALVREFIPPAGRALPCSMARPEPVQGACARIHPPGRSRHTLLYGAAIGTLPDLASGGSGIGRGIPMAHDRWRAGSHGLDSRARRA